MTLVNILSFFFSIYNNYRKVTSCSRSCLWAHPRVFRLLIRPCHHTLHPFGTLLFSGLPMMIWQKNKFFYCPSKKIVKWQKFRTALRNLTKKNCFHQILSESSLNLNKSGASGGQTHGWIPLKKKFYCISFYSTSRRLSSFHREWLTLAKILMI